MRTCAACAAENDDDSRYCDRCGDLLEERAPFRPRYDALARVGNGLGFLSRLAGVAGGLAAIGVLFYFWSRSFLVAVFFAGASALAAYFALVGLRAAGDVVRLFMDLEDHLRSLRSRKP
jgi:hypothetical protein